MVSSILSDWMAIYLMMIFSSLILQEISFFITAKNTIKTTSFKIGLYTSLGITSCNGLFAVLGLLLCVALTNYPTAFKYAQMIGMSYLLFIGIKIMTAERKIYSLDDKPAETRTKIDAYKSGFFYTFSNVVIVMTIVSVMSQFYGYANTSKLSLLMLICIPLISFFIFTIISFCCRFLKCWWLFSQYMSLIRKIAGFIIIILVTTNVKSILS